MSVLGFTVLLAQGCSWRGASAQSPQPFLLYARLLKGAGFHVREPVASSPQPGQLKSCQLPFKDGKLKLSQGQGLAPDTFWEWGISLLGWLSSPHWSLEGARAQQTGFGKLSSPS